MLRQLARGAGGVALGTALGQGTVVAVTPWLARSHTPADFGALALVTTVSNVAVAGACLRYDLALPSAAANQSRPLMVVGIACALGSAALVTGIDAVASLLSHHTLLDPFTNPWIVGLCVLLTGLYQLALAWATRQGAFSRVGAMRCAQGSGFSVLAASHFLDLVPAYVVSFLTAIPELLGAVRSAAPKEVTPYEAARVHWQFPLVSLPGALLDVIGYSLCIWIISANYGASEAGQYSQVQRLVGAPLMLLGMSLGQVLLRHSANFANDPARMAQLFSQALKGMGALGLIVVLLTAGIGEPLLHSLLGGQWRVNTMFITPIALAVAVRACTSPLSMILVTLRRFELSLRWQAAYFASATTVFWLATRHLDVGTFVIIYAAHECLFYGAYLLLIQFAINTSPCAASSA